VAGDGPMLQIGDVAEEVGLSLRTIRHYEEVGVVRPSERSAGGFRLYNQADIERLRLVKRLKPLDFSLDEMRDLLETMERLPLETDDGVRRQLVERLSLFATIAQERCDRLQEQLDNAQALTGQLRRVVLEGHRSANRVR
jgi:MerR family transcriptional regulator, copper efflux regulator